MNAVVFSVIGWPVFSTFAIIVYIAVILVFGVFSLVGLLTLIENRHNHLLNKKTTTILKILASVSLAIAVFITWVFLSGMNDSLTSFDKQLAEHNVTRLTPLQPDVNSHFFGTFNDKLVYCEITNIGHNLTKVTCKD